MRRFKGGERGKEVKDKKVRVDRRLGKKKKERGGQNKLIKEQGRKKVKRRKKKEG